MSRLRCLVLLPAIVFCAFVLGGCSDESLALRPVVEDADLGQNADSNLLRLRVGTSVVVEAIIVHPEIEGSTAIVVHDLVSDDASVAKVRWLHDDQFEIEAVAVGETVLRAIHDHDDRATRPIRVIP
jgi:hypothetical protein